MCETDVCEIQLELKYESYKIQIVQYISKTGLVSKVLSLWIQFFFQKQSLDSKHIYHPIFFPKNLMDVLRWEREEDNICTMHAKVLSPDQSYCMQRDPHLYYQCIELGQQLLVYTDKGRTDLDEMDKGWIQHRYILPPVK